jgi:hypothetical protein
VKWRRNPRAAPRTRSSAASRFFFHVHGVGRRIGAREDDVGLVGHDPLDMLPFPYLQRMRQSRGYRRVELLAALAGDVLNLGLVSHVALLIGGDARIIVDPL